MHMRPTYLETGLLVRKGALMSEFVFEAMCAAFDQMNAAVLILTASGRMLFANRAANAMLDAGWPIRLLDGCLQGKDRSVNASLKRAMELASLNPENPGAHDHEVCLAQPSAELPGAVAYLRPLALCGAEHALVLFVMQAGETSQYGIDGLAEAYGLSKAETRILKALIEAQTTAEAAARLNVALSTVKSHLRKIFQKTNTSRQVDLLRLAECCRTPFRKN